MSAGTTVICDAVAGGIADYVSLSTAQVGQAWLPTAQQRNRPDPLPAILLGQLAVDLRSTCGGRVKVWHVR